jgi:hypothetical protein
MDDLAQNVKASFEAVSLIVVFVFVLFDIRYPQIVRDIDSEIPDPARTKERKNHRRLLLNSILRNSLPLVVVNGVLLYLLSPLVVEILRSSTFQVWNFDFLRTCFVVVCGFVAVFFVWSVALTIRLWYRRHQCR